jgi:hypothetical protein
MSREGPQNPSKTVMEKSPYQGYQLKVAEPSVCLTRQTAMLVWPTASSLWRSEEDDRMIAAQVGSCEQRDL